MLPAVVRERNAGPRIGRRRQRSGERPGECERAVVAIRRLDREALGDHPIDGGPYVVAFEARPGTLVARMGDELRELVRVVEWHLARETLVGHAGEGVHVGARVEI